MWKKDLKNIQRLVKYHDLRDLIVASKDLNNMQEVKKKIMNIKIIKKTLVEAPENVKKSLWKDQFKDCPYCPLKQKLSTDATFVTSMLGAFSFLLTSLILRRW